MIVQGLKYLIGCLRTGMRELFNKNRKLLKEIKTKNVSEWRYTNHVCRFQD